MKVLRNFFQSGQRPVALVFNLDIIISDYYSDFAKIIYDSSNAPSLNTQLVESECDAQTHCATEPQIPSSLRPYVFTNIAYLESQSISMEDHRKV